MDNVPTPINNQVPTPQEPKTANRDTLDTASKLLSTTLTSLDSSQKNALGISDLVDHVEKLSGHEQYVQANDAIMNDPTLTIQEKLRLKQENDEWQDRRTEKGADVVADLQDANTRNNDGATCTWAGPVLVLLSIGICAFFGFTTPGRQLAGAALKAAQHISV